jgi:hypothetical protein
MFSWLIQHHALLIGIAVCAALAVWRGGPAERIGASVNLAIALAWLLAQRLLPHDSTEVVFLGLDGTLAVAFLILSLRFGSLWLGGALLLQGAQFALHSFYFVTERPADRLFAIVSNVVSVSVVVCLLVGVVMNWRHRKRIEPATA